MSEPVRAPLPWTTTEQRSLRPVRECTVATSSTVAHPVLVIHVRVLHHHVHLHIDRSADYGRLGHLSQLDQLDGNVQTQWNDQLIIDYVRS